MEITNNLKLKIVIGIILIVVLIYSYDHFKNKVLNFKGVITSVSYDIKHNPTVKINGITYDLYYGEWDFETNKISKGDILIKPKGRFDLYLIKNNSRDTINLQYQ